MVTSVATHDVDRLKQLYVAGFHDTFLDSAMRKIIDRQIARDEADLQRVNKVLAQFERQYGQTSDEFRQRFQAGQMADDADYMEWNAFCKMQHRIASRLRILRGESTHE
jgi:predicted secreted protein